MTLGYVFRLLILGLFLWPKGPKKHPGEKYQQNDHKMLSQQRRHSPMNPKPFCIFQPSHPQTRGFDNR